MIDQGWATDKRYIEGQLTDLKRGQDQQAELLNRVMSKLNEVESELKSYKRVGQILVAIAGFVGGLAGWIAKAIGKA